MNATVHIYHVQLLDSEPNDHLQRRVNDDALWIDEMTTADLASHDGCAQASHHLLNRMTVHTRSPHDAKLYDVLIYVQSYHEDDCTSDVTATVPTTAAWNVGAAQYG